MRIQTQCRWRKGSVRASPGWGPTPAAAPGTGPLWRERSTVTRGLRCSFPRAHVWPRDTHLWGLRAQRGGSTVGSFLSRWESPLLEISSSLRRSLNLSELVLCFYPVTWVDICIREGPLYKKQKAVNRGPVYGAPPVKGVLTVPSENSAPPGVPLPRPGRLEEWNDERGLVRKKESVRQQWQILGRDFNPLEVFTFTPQKPNTHSGTSHLSDTNSYFFFFHDWLMLLTPYANIIEKYTCNNHIEFKWSWVQFNVYQDSQSIYISLCFLDYFFMWNSLNILKNLYRWFFHSN